MADIFDGIDLSPEQARELETLRRGFAMLNQVIDEPGLGTNIKRKLREKNPAMQIRIPEDDIAAPLLEPIKAEIEGLKTSHAETLTAMDEKKTAIETLVNEFTQKQKDSSDLDDLKKKIDAAAKHYRFTDEGVSTLVKHMQDTNTSDPMTAGAYLVQNMDRPAPMAPTGGVSPETIRAGGSPVDLFNLAHGTDDESLKLLHGTPAQQDKWFRQQVDAVLQEGAQAA